MGKVVSIDRGKILRDYVSRQKAPEFLEHGLFVLGLIATIVVPQVVYCASGGPVPSWAFVVSGEAGVILGLVKCLWPAAQIVSIVDTQTKPASLDDRSRRRKTS